MMSSHRKPLGKASHKHGNYDDKFPGVSNYKFSVLKPADFPRCAWKPSYNSKEFNTLATRFNDRDDVFGDDLDRVFPSNTLR